jgi:hypothetical protein
VIQTQHLTLLKAEETETRRVLTLLRPNGETHPREAHRPFAVGKLTKTRLYLLTTEPLDAA